jgi:hypothetical protein
MLEKSMELPFLLYARLYCARGLPISAPPARRHPIRMAPMTVFIRSIANTTESGRLELRFIDKRFLPKPSARRQPAGFFWGHGSPILPGGLVGEGPAPANKSTKM